MFSFVYIAAFIVLITICAGIYIYKGGKLINGRRFFKLSIGSFVVLIGAFLIMLVPGIAKAATPNDQSKGLGYLAAALSTGLATIGTGYAVGSVGSSALGAVSEDPKILGKTLIFVGLAEGIAIYGLIVSIMIFGRL